MSTWVCACICFSFVPEMIERMKVWYVIEFWHKCTEGLKNLIRISSIRNNKKYPTIKKIFEAGDFYAILSDIVEKIIVYSSFIAFRFQYRKVYMKKIYKKINAFIIYILQTQYSRSRIAYKIFLMTSRWWCHDVQN